MSPSAALLPENRNHPRWRARLAATAALLVVATPGFGAGKKFDVNLDDRVDPVPPLGEITYEVEVRIGGSDPAPDVELLLSLPSGTTFMEARRAPGWDPLSPTVLPDGVLFDLGDEVPCDKKNLPECRDIWIAVQVDAGTAPGTVLETSVELRSSDPGTFPTDTAVLYTSVGTQALRRGRISLSRGRVLVKTHLGRTGMHSPLDPGPANIELDQGLRIILREPGMAPVYDLTIPPGGIECRGRPELRLPERCKLENAKAWKPLGLRSLRIFKPGDFAQRNNAVVRMRLQDVPLLPDFGPDVEIEFQAAGESYVDEGRFDAPAPDVLKFQHHQFEP